MTSIDGVHSEDFCAKATFGSEYRAIKRSPMNEVGPDLLEAISPAAMEDVVIVFVSPVENPGEEEDECIPALEH